MGGLVTQASRRIATRHTLNSAASTTATLFLSHFISLALALALALVVALALFLRFLRAQHRDDDYKRAFAAHPSLVTSCMALAM